MRVLVTGATGFLGGVLVERLRKSGHEVVAAARSAPSERIMEYASLVLRGDLADLEYTDECASKVDAVVHTAAKPGVWGDYGEYYESNVVATENLLESCREKGVRFFVYTGTPSSVFDMKDQSGVDESVPYPSRYYSPYPQTKAIAERRVLSAACDELRTVSLRPHLIWGPGDRHLFPRLASRMRSGRMTIVNGGRNRIDATYVDNVADAHILALERLASDGWERVCGKPYFITNDEPMTMREILSAMIKATGLSGRLIDVPGPLACLAGAAMEMIHRISGSRKEPLLTRFVVREFMCDHWFDISAAKRDLGYRPSVSMEEGMKRLGKWALENGVL